MESGRRVVLSDITPVGTARGLPVRRARIVIKQGPELAPGDRIRLPVRFYPVPGPVIPGGFDTQFHAYFDGIGAYGNSTGAPTVIAAGSGTAPDRFIDTIRRGIAARIDQGLVQPAAGIARAIIIGDQSAVTDAARDTMATAGIAHVLSVSGLHLTIVAGGVFVALRMLLSVSDGLARRISVKRFAAIGGIVSAVLYYSISGGNVAALRSTIMIVLVFGAVVFGRRAITMRNVAIAALLVIAFDPASVFRPSFQLSFAAVAALVGAYEMLRGSGGEEGLIARLLGYFRGIVITSLVAGAATLVFSVYHFQQTSPLGVLGNLLTLPLVGFVMMPAALLAVLAMPFGIEGPLLNAMGWSIDRMLDLAGVVAAWSSGISASPLLTPLALLLGAAALGWFAFFPDRYRLIGPALLLPAVLLFAMDRPPDVLISDTTRAVALRADAGLELIDGKPNSFAVERLARHLCGTDRRGAAGGRPLRLHRVHRRQSERLPRLRGERPGSLRRGLRQCRPRHQPHRRAVQLCRADGHRCRRTGGARRSLAAVGRGPKALRGAAGDRRSQPAVASFATLTPAAGIAALPTT